MIAVGWPRALALFLENPDVRRDPNLQSTVLARLVVRCSSRAVSVPPRTRGARKIYRQREKQRSGAWRRFFIYLDAEKHCECYCTEQSGKAGFPLLARVLRLVVHEKAVWRVVTVSVHQTRYYSQRCSYKRAERMRTPDEAVKVEHRVVLLSF